MELEVSQLFKDQIIDLISECLNDVKTRQQICDDDLVNEAKAAEILDLAKGTLTVWRHEGKGPNYIKLGTAVRYKYRDLTAYIDQQSVKAGVQ